MLEAGIMREVLEPTPWLLMAGAGSVVTGLCHVLLRARLAGGGLGTVASALRDRSGAVATIVVIDLLAGVAAGLLAAVAGASQPAAVVNFVNSNPALGWMAIGVVGPFLSDRTFTGSIVRGRFDPEAARVRADKANLEQMAKDGARIRDDAWRLRTESVKSIEMRIWVIVQAELGDEAERLRLGMEALYRSDIRKLARLPGLVRAMPDGWLPNSVERAVVRLETDALPVAESGDLLLALVQELIDAQMWEPLEVLCPQVSNY